MKTDIEIQKYVMDELLWDPMINPAEVGVAVKDGIVTLSGQVDTYLKKIAAEKAAKRIKEVKGIVEDIVVKLPRIGKRTDLEIADAIIKTLQWNAHIPEEKVKIKVEDGRVLLEGSVPWEFQKKQITKLINGITGVTGVINMISIDPIVKASVVKDKIKLALERSAEIEAKNIDVDAMGNKVVLRGKVKNWNEKDEVERAAWNAPGVAMVENNLLIE